LEPLFKVRERLQGTRSIQQAQGMTCNTAYNKTDDSSKPTDNQKLPTINGQKCTEKVKVGIYTTRLH
jgi:hypothetical protein